MSLKKRYQNYGLIGDYREEVEFITVGLNFMQPRDHEK
jgi:hypothetical protein